MRVGSNRAFWLVPYLKPSLIDHPRLQLPPPHMPLWLKLIKIIGFIDPSGVWYGGFSSWLFCPGYHTISEDQNNNRLRLAAGLEGDGKTSIKDFNKILGSTTYAKPKVIEDASKMLEAVSKTAVKLAGDQPQYRVDPVLTGGHAHGHNEPRDCGKYRPYQPILSPTPPYD